MTTRARVALIRTTPETVLQDYERVMELVEFRRHLDPSVATILKPDLRRHFPFPAANSPPWQLEAVVRALSGAGYCDLVCVQQNVALVSAFKGADLNGYLPVLRANGIAPFRIPEEPRGANIVLLPTLKTDSVTTIGGALSSAAGGLLPARSLAMHGPTHELLVDALVAYRERYAGMFAVMDGTTAGNGLGLYRLAPEVKNVILAAADPVALDTAAAKLMGFDPLRDVAHLRLAHERGLGVGDPRDIALVGDGDLACANWRFGARGRLDLGDRLPLPCFSAHGPLAYLLALAAECYHDYYRWPFVERRVFEGWLRGTQWGRLFARYQRMGVNTAEPRLSAEL